MVIEFSQTLLNPDPRIDDLLDQLTLEEKASLTVGRDFWSTQPVERLGIPSIWLSDGPTGVRKSLDPAEAGIGQSEPATCFPTASALSASWDVDLLKDVGRTIATEAQALGVQILLGPGVNMKRSPLGGRNFEYLSEDPVLAGELAAAFVNGVQGEGVGGCPKHFVANECETERMTSDSLVDERTLREIYLRPFEIAIRKSQPWALMSAYNRVNGVYASENRWLLHDIVHEEWGYRGIIMSDWLAVTDRPDGINAGLHLQMPAAPTVQGIVDAVRNGDVAESRLDEIVRDLLNVIFVADAARRPETTFDADEHHRYARQVAGECLTLLKNQDATLPLDVEKCSRVALIGAFAREPRIQGGGSSEVVPTKVENLHDELRVLLGDDIQMTFSPGYDLADDASDAHHALIQNARTAAADADVAIVMVGLPDSYENEGRDRTHINLPASHDALVDAVLEVQPNTIVVLVNGSAVAMPWADGVPAILEGWLGGQSGAGAIADVLMGKVNPSGKLAETFARKLSDTPAYLTFPGDAAGSMVFGEGVFTGYRWYDAREIEPLFPFGHGLSYTSFEYTDLQTSAETVRDDETLDVSVTVKNTGERAGKEIVQLYLGEREPRFARPPHELKAFAKIALEPGEEGTLTFQLTGHDFTQYDVAHGDWFARSGEFDLVVGASSRDIRLRSTVTLETTKVVSEDIDRFTTLARVGKHPGGRQALETLFADRASSRGSFEEAIAGFLGALPLGKLVVMGLITEEQLQGLIQAING